MSKHLRAGRILSDFGSLQSQSAHQTFLIEEEHIDALLQRRGRERLCYPCIDHDEARCRANLKPATLMQIR